MNLLRISTLAIFILSLPLSALAGNTTFTNSDGTFSSTGVTDGTLTLTGSTLIGLQGLSPYVSPNPLLGANLGTLSFTTGSMTSGNILSGATFGTGGSISVTYSNGVVFTGSFSNGATWTVNSTTNSWTFVGAIANGTLTVPGYAPVTIANAVTVDLTTVGAAPTASGSGYVFEDNGGTLNFPEPSLTPVPELGTLTLLGSGLVGVAIWARRRSRKTNARES